MKIDDKIADLGYVIVYEDTHRIHYERYDEMLECHHTVCIYHNPGSNRYMLSSYSETGNQTYIPLEGFEVDLFLQKLKHKEREYLKLHNLT